MPGMEVFTISGAGLGYDAVASAIALDRKRAAAARGGGTGSSSGSGMSGAPPVLLQNALKALGAAHGDGALNIAVDGIIGPGTVKAVNYALKTYIGAGPLQAAGLSGRFLNATSTKSDVQQYAGTLATIVAAAVRSAGGTIPDPVVTPARSRGGGSSSPVQTAPVVDNTQMNPNLVWVGTGIAVIVVALGFMAARRRASAA